MSTLLPKNESTLTQHFEEAVGGRIDALLDVNLSSLSATCDPKFLAVLAKSMDVDIGGLETKEARLLLQSALYLKQYAGTKAGLQKALGALYFNVTIDDQVGNYDFDVEVVLQSDLSQQKLEAMRRILQKHKNVRSRLRHFVMRLQNCESAYVLTPMCVFGVSYEINAWNLTQHNQTTMHLESNAVFRLQFQTGGNNGGN